MRSLTIALVILMLSIWGTVGHHAEATQIDNQTNICSFEECSGNFQSQIDDDDDDDNITRIQAVDNDDDTDDNQTRIQ